MGNNMSLSNLSQTSSIEVADALASAVSCGERLGVCPSAMPTGMTYHYSSYKGSCNEFVYVSVYMRIDSESCLMTCAHKPRWGEWLWSRLQGARS